MTNDAPKRVWVEPSYNAFGDRNWIEGFEGCGQEYIRADHAQAEKEAAVAAEREACASRLESLKDTAYQNNLLVVGITYSCAIDAIRARADTDALEAVKAEAKAEARQVKPLEWWRSDTGDLFCDTLVGRYQIQKGRERYFMMPAMSPGRRNRPDGEAVPSWHKSEESAKAAAQDDYERRVLSALIPANQKEDQ